PEMPHRHGLAVHAVGGGLLAGIHEVRGNLVAEEIEIDPALRLAAWPAAEHVDEEAPRGRDVGDGKREMEARPRHAPSPSSHSRGRARTSYSFASGVPGSGT